MNARTRSERNRRADGEGGFTLLEMMIAVVLLTLITGAISAAFISSMNATSATKQRVNASNDAQLISGFLTRDAQAAGGTNPATGLADPTLGVTAGAFAAGCSATPPGTPILGFKWIDLASSTTYESNYSYVASATPTYRPQQLLRTICTSTAATPPVTDIGTSVLANNVVTTSTATLNPPAAWCDSNQPPAAPACPTPFPKTVSLALSVINAAQSLTPPFSFTLTASLRPQSDSSPDFSSSAAASLVLLGNGACPTPPVPSIGSQSASFHITIYGSATLSGCATQLKKDVIPFGPVYVSAPGTCADFPASPPCTVVTNAFTDPFKAKIASGALTAPPVNCSGTAPAVGADGHWQPGTYPQDPQSGVDRAFDPGIYVFCNGLSGNVTANLQGGPIGGTLFYFSDGAFNALDVQLTPPTTGQYTGLALWQPVANNSTMTFSKSLVNITGTVYAPSATVNMKNGSVNINQLVAFAIDGNPGNPDVHIGPPLRVMLPVDLVSGQLPPATKGQIYSGGQAIAVDGTGVYSGWTISGVAGLTISNTGVIGGTPSASVTPGVYTVTVGVNDSDGEHATTTAQITVYAALSISGSLPNWVRNVPGYPANPLTAGGGLGPYTWAASGMPAGLAMDATGTISGTPNTAATYHPAITITDSLGHTFTENYTVVINPPVSALTITSSNTNGKPEQGDVITITFSGAINPSSVCNTWGAGANTTSNKTTQIILTKNVSGNDTLRLFDSAACTFQVFSGGSLNLGATGYVTTTGVTPTTAVFANASKCNGNSHCSQISINATDTVLQITLGDLASGTVGTVSPNPGTTYTPDPALGVVGTAIDNNKFF